MGTFITRERLAIINRLYNNTLHEQTIDQHYDSREMQQEPRVEIYIPWIKKENEIRAIIVDDEKKDVKFYKSSSKIIAPR